VACEREVEIRNKEGLHFRPIMQLVDLANRFKSRVTVHVAERAADGRSPMELLMLVATQGTKVRLAVDGEDAQKALDELAALFESGFGEP
jgi:phosphocarrier protein HPr